MSEEKSLIFKTIQPESNDSELRFFPFVIAGLICFTIAVFLGSGSWLLFGSDKRKNIETSENTFPNQLESPAKHENITEIPSKTPFRFEDYFASKGLKGVVEVSGSEISIGGGETKRPIERIKVDSFFIAQTEVTNSQYVEFIKETNYQAPLGWKNKTYPKDTGEFPVTNVSFDDAEKYCQWLAEKTGLPVRMPTEAEWELAARGTENIKYPWGNEWNEKNAASKETNGKVSAVKSFPLNRSPFGAYDMVGNVWEWTQDKVDKDEVVTDESVREALNNGQVLRVVKGGSALISFKEISVQARYEIPEITRVPSVGFRYVVEAKPME